MVLLTSVSVPLGSPIIDFDLLNIDGKTCNVASFAEASIVVLIFTCNHCPYAKAVETRLIDFQKKYNDRGVQVVAINSNDAETYPDDSYDNMCQLAEIQAYPFPYLYDETQEVAKAYKAQCTPDIYVYDQDRKLTYHGRFDDNWQHPDQVQSRDLEEAVLEILAGRTPSDMQHPSMGCSIKWKD